eukprot:scaffold11994_cov85-Phaeocystis_antarctica.AAC.4
MTPPHSRGRRGPRATAYPAPAPRTQPRHTRPWLRRHWRRGARGATEPCARWSSYRSPAGAHAAHEAGCAGRRCCRCVSHRDAIDTIQQGEADASQACGHALARVTSDHLASRRSVRRRCWRQQA